MIARDTPAHLTTAREASLALDLSRFIPAGYSLLDSASGDLNGDPHPDLALVLRKDGEDSTSDVIDHPELRPLLLLTSGASGAYALAARTDKAVYCVDCGGVMGDPYTGLTVKNGYISVEHYGGSGWRWTRIVTFKYDAKERHWFLHRDGGESFHATEPEKVEETVRTTKDFGRVRLEDFDIYRETE